VISSTLLDVLLSKDFGLNMLSPISNIKLSFVGYSFVDNTDLLQSNGDNSTNTVIRLQEAIDTWEGVLKATGGALGPDKSYWYLVSFKWCNGKWFYTPVTDTPATLFMNDINGISEAGRRISPDQAEETFGVWIAPNGNTKTQYEKLLDKALLWADQMRTGVIRKDETWLALQSTIWRTLCYPLNATNLTQVQCKRIMSPILNYALPAMGVYRNFPRAIVFSRLTHAGIGIKHIHTLQEIARLKDILQHTYSRSTTGLLYKASLEYLILEIGMGTNLTIIDYNKYQSLATNSLIKSNWQFINRHQITLHHDIKVPANTTDDLLLMPTLCKLQPTIEELESLNQCHLYLQAYYVSDLSTVSGKQLSHHAWKGTVSTQDRTNKFNWPA
jgi:hypothetical protein